jgi:tellurite resistance protein TehA-like permease
MISVFQFIYFFKISTIRLNFLFKLIKILKIPQFMLLILRWIWVEHHKLKDEKQIVFLIVSTTILSKSKESYKY